MENKGIFYGVSLGPGDPELMTVKAIRLIEKTPVIAYPVTISGATLAKDIAAAMVDLSDKKLIELRYSMEHDHARQHQGHLLAAGEIRAYLEQGQDVAMLNLGDISVYSTYTYLRDILREEGFESQMIPGITSFCAIASQLNIALVEHSQQLHVAADSADVEELLSLSGTKVLMKSGRQMPAVIEKLRDKGLLETTAMISNCGLPDEEVYPDLTSYDPDRKAGYFTTLIIKEK